MTSRAKAEIQNLLNELSIKELTNTTVDALCEEMVARVSALVSVKEDDHQPIDEELLQTYDFLIDFIIAHEDDLDFLSKLFYE